jgi:hypothetical protein
MFTWKVIPFLRHPSVRTIQICFVYMLSRTRAFDLVLRATIGYDRRQSQFSLAIRSVCSKYGTHESSACLSLRPIETSATSTSCRHRCCNKADLSFVTTTRTGNAKSSKKLLDGPRERRCWPSKCILLEISRRKSFWWSHILLIERQRQSRESHPEFEYHQLWILEDCSNHKLYFCRIPILVPITILAVFKKAARWVRPWNLKRLDVSWARSVSSGFRELSC